MYFLSPSAHSLPPPTAGAARSQADKHTWGSLSGAACMALCMPVVVNTCFAHVHGGEGEPGDAQGSWQWCRPRHDKLQAPLKDFLHSSSWGCVSQPFHFCCYFYFFPSSYTEHPKADDSSKLNLPHGLKCPGHLLIYLKARGKTDGGGERAPSPDVFPNCLQ